ncbi:MAG TPA: DUF924 family protein [Albitalea sp.]|nr:DUF924 family protein [Albitalea sp.]
MSEPHAAPSQAREVLRFWFADGGLRDEWFRKDESFDALIRERFGTLVERAIEGGLLDWQDAPDAALARILLLDQFTRNIHRGTARAFAGDALALAAARSMVSTGQDLALPPERRAFVYLPFEHAEDLVAQDEAVRLFTALAHQAPEMNGMLDYARRHRAVIARFGRFPHRNAALGRASTPEEAAFLQQPGSGF